jgi:hypothetical protein
VPRDNGHGPACFCGCGNGERTNGRIMPRPERPRRSRRQPGGASHGTHPGNSVASNIVAAALGVAQALTVTGAADLQPGYGGTFDQNWAERSLQAQADQRSRDLDEGTRQNGYEGGYTD